MIEQQCLGGEIVVKAGMVIQMILAEIGECARLDSHTVQTPLVQSVAGCLHRRMAHAGLGGLGQDAVQGQRIGRRVLQRSLEIALNAHRAKADRTVAQRLPDLAGETGDRGLAGCAGDGHHMTRLRLEPQGRGSGKGRARILGDDQRAIPIGQRPGRDVRPGAVGQHRRRLHAQGVANEFRPMHRRSRQGGEQMARPDRPAIQRKSGDRGIQPIPGPQAQLRQRLSALPHDLTRHLFATSFIPSSAADSTRGW